LGSGSSGFNLTNFAIAIDGSGNAYTTGYTNASDFPTTSGAFQTTYGGGNSDAFVSKLNAAGSALLYSTYLGGNNWDSSGGIAIDASGNAYVTGQTFSSDFPTTAGTLQAICSSCTSSTSLPDAFLTKLNATGSALLYSTYLGGSGEEEQSGAGIAIDASGSVFLTGDTTSLDLPTTPGAFQATSGGSVDAFIAKISFASAPGIALGPGSLSFGQQAVGTTSAPLTVALLDAGSLPLNINSIVATGDFAQTNTCGSTVQPGVSCSLSVTFKPNGTGILLPAVTLTPASLTFAGQRVGTTSAPQPVILTNSGDGTLNITSIATSGDFAQTNNCGSAVQPGKNCTLSVTFTPTATGKRTGAISITDNAPGSPQTVSLTGTGTSGSRPVVNLTPASVPFLVLRTVGTTSLPQTVTLTNVGGAELDVTGITLTGPDPGDFAQSNNCRPTVASGASCLITVTFKPTAQGVRTASVSITDNAPGSPQTVPLSGRGTFLNWSPRQINLGDRPVGTSSPARTVNLTNAGTAPITLFSIEVGGVNAGHFSETNTCGASLKAGASCTIEVTFTPTAVGGRIGHVAIRDNAFGGTHWVGLLGKGT
jgi:hypothetical protein